MRINFVSFSQWLILCGIVCGKYGEVIMLILFFFLLLTFKKGQIYNCKGIIVFFFLLSYFFFIVTHSFLRFLGFFLPVPHLSIYNTSIIIQWIFSSKVYSTVYSSFFLCVYISTIFYIESHQFRCFME